MGTIAKITAGGTTHSVASSAYGTCSTAAATAAKVVTMSDFDTLINGMTIHVYFTYSNTATNPTLNVNSKGAKPIYKYGTTAPGKTAATSWQAGSIVSFTYNTIANANGCWMMNDHLDDTDNNTTYSAGTGLNLSGTTFSNSGATGIKGNSESSYRTGQVNLTAANIGAVALSGDTMTGQLKTSFKNSVAMGSYNVNATTIPDVCEELRYSSGCCGSVNITTAYTKDGYTIPTHWYNFLWIPHRSGGINGAANGDNCNYGILYLTGMNSDYGKMWIVNYSNSTIQTLTEVTAFKTHTHSPADLTSGYLNIHPENNPVLIPFMHNDIAHLLQRGGNVVYKENGTTVTKDVTNLFDASGSYLAYNASSITEIVIELTLHRTFVYNNWIYIDFGNAGWRAKTVKIEVMNDTGAYPNDIWTEKYSTTTNALGHVAVSISHTPVGASNAGAGFNKLRFTLSNWASSQFRISQIGIYNYGSLGLRETYMSRGDDDLVYRDISPNSNNIYSLGTTAHKWKNVYANTLNGTTIPSTPKFTDTTYTASTVSIGSASAGTAIPADDITAWTTNTPTAVVPATVVTGGTTASITPVTKKTVVTGGSTVSITPVTSKTVVTGGTTTSITPVTAKTVVTSASGATASVSYGVLTLTNGSFRTGDSVTTGTAINAYTGLTTGASVNTGTAQTVVSGLTTGDSVTTGTAVTVYKSLTTGPAATVTAGTAASLSYTAKSIPNISVTSKDVVTSITAN